jgi:hypothetical protein
LERVEVTPPRRRGALFAAFCLLAGCVSPPVPPAITRPIEAPRAEVLIEKAPPPSSAALVEVPRCPGRAEIARLREARPKPLREQKMPATTSERVAKIAAQLGLYEAEGQWADQVERMFRKCDDH